LYLVDFIRTNHSKNVHSEASINQCYPFELVE
jgi:hypothetical protein